MKYKKGNILYSKLSDKFEINTIIKINTKEIKLLSNVEREYKWTININDLNKFQWNLYNTILNEI